IPGTESWTRFGRCVPKNPVTIVLQEQRLFLIGHVLTREFDHLIDMTCDYKHVKVSIIIIIKETDAPANIGLGEPSESGTQRAILKRKASPIEMERMVFVVKVRHNNVWRPVAI